MKAARLVALGGAVVFGVSLATAQPPAQGASTTVRSDTARSVHRARRPRDGKQAARTLFRGVDLTQTQRNQLRVIQKTYAQQRRTLVQQLRAQSGAARPDSAARAQLRAQVRALREKQLTETRALLTPEQQKAFDTNVAARRERAKAHRTRKSA
jgi:Spy/CpxP family protein refolding chaperone